MDWQPIETAPKDGTPIWAYLKDYGIRLVRWTTAEENADNEGGHPDEFISGWFEVADPWQNWSPQWYLTADTLPAPPQEK